jgi:uncharacterized membrane protein YvbJ
MCLAMIRCSICGEDNPERARFCLNCGNALEAEGRMSPDKVRKTVSEQLAQRRVLR